MRKKIGLWDDSYKWLYHVTLRFHTVSRTELERLQKYVELCSERYDGSNSSSTSVRYGDALLSRLRLAVDEPIFTSCSGNFGYVYNGNVNAASSRSIFRAKLDDNLMVMAYKPW
ncbi:hypothetical protein H3V17_02885 [Bartonella sp. M0283]|uniref:hypothetical protein n=1 Tax=Bartonella sp. M0283 TaxID=2751016 RepID=UPI0018DD4A93|nr:hypothetical protein [Bartonella sp. M0283]MBI0162592.1 hypothetical protein [Bartonella sp. M0283]